MMTPTAVEQAKIALRNFRSLQPTLTQYARMLTGRSDVRVEAHANSNGKTDGKIIYYRPPISLGRELPHKKNLCNRRNADMQLRCEACAQREDVLTTIYHEIAHIWFNSFDSLTDAAKAAAIRQAVAEMGTAYGAKIQARLDTLGSRVGYMGLASMVSPFMPLLLNALEDARVNRALFYALPGTKVMFQANTSKVFCEGVEQLDEHGKWIRDKWSERPLNLQAMIAMFCMASGYDFSGWLDKFVVESLNDAKLKDLVRQLDSAANVDSTFTLAFPILARLRELGFCRTEDDPAEPFEPPYEEEPEESDDDATDASTDDDDDPADKDEPDGASDESGNEGSSPAKSGDEQPDDVDSGDKEGDGSGGDSEPADESGNRDDAGQGDGEDDGDAEETATGGEINDDDDTDGSDSPESGSDGDEASDSADATDDGSPGSGDSDPSPDGGGEPDGDEVREEDNGAGESGESPVDGNSDDRRDGNDLDGTDGRVDGADHSPSGDEGIGEPGLDDGDVDGGLGGGQPGESPDQGPGDVELDDDEVIDLGAVKKAVRVEGEKLVKPDLPWGTADDASIAVAEIGEHEVPDSVHTHDDDDSSHHGHSHSDEEDAERQEGDDVIKRVLLAGIYFEQPSVEVSGVHFNNDESGYFTTEYESVPPKSRRSFGTDGDFDPPESVVNPVVSRARVVFSNNRRWKFETGLKRGRIHSPSLAMKAPANDPTMMRQRRLPGRTEYFVGIAIDASGSTIGESLVLSKKVAFAEAEVLSRLGIPFFIYAHHGDYAQDYGGPLNVEIIEIKHPEDPWNDKARERLRRLQPGGANLDGHTIQVYRKILEKQRGKKILHYYSDGAMPCENFEEELFILRGELRKYKKAGHVLAGVGIRCDEPRKHGLETVQVDSAEDVMKVIMDLEKRLQQH